MAWLRYRSNSWRQVTLELLKQAEQLGVTGLWLQPGAEDAEVVAYIAQSEGLRGKVVHSGPCILVEGAALAAAASSHLSGR